MITLNILTDMCNWWWLWWLLPFILGYLLGRALMKKWETRTGELEDIVKGKDKLIAELEEALADCKKSRIDLQGQVALMKGILREAGFNADGSKNDQGGGKGNFGKESSGYSSSSASLGLSDSSSTELKDSDSSDDNSSSEDKTSNTSGSGLDIDTGGSDTSAIVSSLGASGLSTDSTSSEYAKLKEDNLQVIEGIGPKMNQVLIDNGINSWSSLASKSGVEVKAVLDKYGDKYRIIDPADWPRQAELAAAGNWDGLIAFQKEDGSDSKAEKLMIKLGIIKAYKENDLKAIEGIGPKIEQLLNDAGITTWRSLANTSVEHLKEILANAGDRFKLADPDTWPKQADYAANGAWDDLERYQDFLNGGKNPG